MFAAKTAPFKSSFGDHRCKEKSLIQRTVYTKSCTNFHAQSRAGHTVGGIFHTVFSSCDITTDRSKAATWIFDQGADHDICTYITGLDGIYEFSVAVIYHADHIRLDLFYKRDQLTDLFYGERRTGLIAFGTLDGYQLCFSLTAFLMFS